MSDVRQHWMEGDWPDIDLEQEEDKCIKRLCSLCKELIEKLPPTNCDSIVEELEVALHDVLSIYEDNDPKSMGWVGDDGLP